MPEATVTAFECKFLFLFNTVGLIHSTKTTTALKHSSLETACVDNYYKIRVYLVAQISIFLPLHDANSLSLNEIHIRLFVKRLGETKCH